MIFNAELYHAGIPIVYGTRFLLVGFCFTSEPNVSRSGDVVGNVNLELFPIMVNRFVDD